MAKQFIDKPSLEKIRKRFWQIAEVKGITLEDLQDRTEFSYSQVYRIVRGKNNMSVSGFLAICQALEVQTSEVLDFTLEIPTYGPLRKDRKLS